MKEWQKHIRRTRADKLHESWCGVRLYSHDWTFVDVDHALHSIEMGTRVAPCPACLAKIQEIIAGAPGASLPTGSS
jgi:hypothetical protein